MILFWVASIGFFLFIFRQILLFSSLWQRAEYNLQDFLQLLFIDFKRKKEYGIFIFVFFILCAFYGVVIFYDQLTFTFQILVTIFFLYGGILLLLDVKRNSLTKPLFTIFSLVIITATLFITSFLFMTPLMDSFAWLLILYFFIPICITIVIVLCLFPREVYFDFIFQQTKKRLENNKTKTILIIGEKDKDSIVRCILKILFLEKQTSLLTTNSSLIQIAKFLTKAPPQRYIFLHCVPRNYSSARKIISLFHPDAMIYISAEINDFSDKNLFIKIQKYFIDLFPKNSVILLNAEDTTLFQLSQRISKTIVLYGTKQNIHEKDLFLKVDVTRKRKDTMHVAVMTGKRTHFYTTHLHAKNMSVILPALFLGHVWGISQKELEKRIYFLGYAKHQLVKKR